jgi:hypothetical protein
MKIIKRILNFNKDDWNHLWWLFKNMIKEFIAGNYDESVDAFYWIKIHFTYDSKRIR